MSPEKLRPEAVFCELCADRRPFHHLAGHLAHVHGTNQQEYRQLFNIPDEPLFSRQYSENRSIAARDPRNIQHIRALNAKWADFRDQAIKALVAQNIFTTGQAADITGLHKHTFQRARREGRLSVGLVCLVHFIPKGEGHQSVRIPGVPRALITQDDLLPFIVHTNQKKFKVEP